MGGQLLTGDEDNGEWCEDKDLFSVSMLFVCKYTEIYWNKSLF